MDKSIITLFDQGKSLKEIGRITGNNRKLVSKFIKESGRRVIPRGITTRIGKYQHNYDAFREIASEGQAYWYGFLLGDGYISDRGVIEVTLAEKDKKHLERLRDFLSPSSPLHYKETKCNGNIYPSYRLYVSSREIEQDLLKLGCFRNKSCSASISTGFIIDLCGKNILNHFLRGYFDANGYTIISRKQAIIGVHTGSINLLEVYKIPFEVLLKKKINIHKRPGFNCYHISLGGNIQCKTIATYLYENATIFLDRKWEILAPLFRNG